MQKKRYQITLSYHFGPEIETGVNAPSPGVATNKAIAKFFGKSAFLFGGQVDERENSVDVLGAQVFVKDRNGNRARTGFVNVSCRAKSATV